MTADLIHFLAPQTVGAIHRVQWSRLLTLASAGGIDDVSPFRVDRKFVHLPPEETTRLADAIEKGAEVLDKETPAQISIYSKLLREGAVTLSVAREIADIPPEAFARGLQVTLAY